MMIMIITRSQWSMSTSKPLSPFKLPIIESAMFGSSMPLRVATRPGSREFTKGVK